MILKIIALDCHVTENGFNRFYAIKGYVPQVVVEPYYYHFAGDAVLSLSNNLIVIPRYRLISRISRIHCTYPIDYVTYIYTYVYTGISR